MNSNDYLHSTTSPFLGSSNLLTNDLQLKLNMLFALSQQQQINSDSNTKRLKKTIPLTNDLPTQVPLISAIDSTNDRDLVKVVTTAGPQSIDKEFFQQLVTRKDVIPVRKRRDFIPNEMKDDHYWERRRKNNLAAKRSREKRRLNDIVLETKVVELTNENETLKAKLNLMLSRLNMKESEMESLFEEEQRLGNICLKPITQQNIHDNEDDQNSNDNAVDLSRNDVKTENLLTKSPSPLTPSPSPQNESLLQILANQINKTKQHDCLTSSNLLKIASPIETKGNNNNNSTLKRNFNQIEQDDDAAMTLLSLNKQSTPVEQQVALQSVINGLLRKPNPPKSPVDYKNSQQIQCENFHQNSSFEQWKTLINCFAMPPTQQSSLLNTNIVHSHQQNLMPLKLRMKMLNTKN